MIKKCLGCGVNLQDVDKNRCGYVKDINKDICERCFKIKYYNDYKEERIDDDNIKHIFDDINNSNDLIIYVASLFNLSDINNIKGDNVLLVLTKKDILPKSVKDKKIISYVNSLDVKFKDVVVVSSFNNYNLDNLYGCINKYKTSNRVYVIGKTNSGKSTLINKLVKNYGIRDYDVTCSMYPNTTLDMLDIYINDDLHLIDTPGVVSNDNIIFNINSKEFKNIMPKKEIKPRVYQLKRPCSLIINDMIRLDYLDNVVTSLIIYISNDVKIVKCGIDNGRFNDLKVNKFRYIFKKDIVIDDFCFIKVTNRCNIDVYANFGIRVYDRDNLI